MSLSESRQFKTTRAPRRTGNTLILVTAILVLLVIIATAFISRTQSGRALATAQQRAFQREDQANLVADQVAAEIAQSLFPKPIDPLYQAQADGFGADTVGWVQGGGSTGILAASTWSGVPRTSPGTDGFMRFTAERYQPDPGDHFVTDNWGQVTAAGTDGVPDGIFDFNYARFVVAPFTNWPDDPNNLLAVPSGPGAPNGLLLDDHGLALGAGNPHGNPGFGDTRWLRDTEPRRMGPYYDGPNEESYIHANDDPYSERFTHWTHLSWIPSAENGWRVCYDISNVAPLNAYDPNNSAPNNGNTLSSYAFEAGGTPYANVNFPVALQTPYEQWYTNVIPPSFDYNPYNNSLPFEGDQFADRRDYWFGAPQVHFNAAKNSGGVLPNFIDLAGLKWGEEFNRWNSGGQSADLADRIGGLRRMVERTFCDTDGDGFTDSFWFLPPSPVDRGVRQVVGVSVVDNAGMLDANVATIFDRWSTSGTTPSDLALASRIAHDEYVDPDSIQFDPFDSHVGLLGDPKNRVNDSGFYPDSVFGGYGLKQEFRPERWFITDNVEEPTFLNMRGLTDLQSFSGNGAGPFVGQFRSLGTAQWKNDPRQAEYERRLWNRAAQRDGNGSYIQAFGNVFQLVPFTTTPFAISDELELRSFSGQNHPTTYSRFERALDDICNVESGGYSSMLRSSFSRQETTPVRTLAGQFGNGSLGQPATGKLSNEQLVRDMRHRITLLSGTRNELRPMWMWQTPFFRFDYDYDRDGDPEFDQNGNMITPGDYQDFAEFERRKRKIDLRQSYALPTNQSDIGNTHNNYPSTQGSYDWFETQRLWLNDLQDTITRATTVYGVSKPDPTNSSTWRTIPQSYFTSPEWDPEAQHGGGGGSPDDFQSAYVKTLRMAASMTANIEAFRDVASVPYTFAGETVLVDPPLHPYHARRVPLMDPNDPSSQVPIINNRDPRDDAFIGLEKQPFIMQAYFGLVYPKGKHGRGPFDPATNDYAWDSGDTVPMPFPDGGENYVDDKSEPAIVVAIQLGNPFHEPISLVDYKLRIGSKDNAVNGTEDDQDSDEYLSLALMKCPHPETLLDPSGASAIGGYRVHDLVLGSTEPEAPRTAVIFALVPPRSLGTGAEFKDGNGSIPGFGVEYEEFKRAWLDSLDLEPGALFGYEEDMPLSLHQTLVLDASNLMSARLPSNVDERLETIFSDNDHATELIRTISDPQGFAPNADVVLDRLQHPNRPNADPRAIDFNDTMERLGSEDHTPPEESYFYEINDPTRREWAGIRLGTDDFYLTWARVSRMWGWDVDASGMYDMDEISPRYAYSVVSGPDLVEVQQEGYFGEDRGFARTNFKGDTFAITETEIGAPDTNQWMVPRPRTMPITRIVDIPQAEWEWKTNPPPAWQVRGKPTNFPTWTVVDQSGQSVEYGLGFPIECFPLNGNWSNTSGYELDVRTISPTGTAVDFTQKDVIPMDLGAKDQTDFYEKYREVIFSSPMQMLVKDDDFEQTGELTHVFLWGPVLDLPLSVDPNSYAKPIDARRTFAEIMTEVAVFPGQHNQTQYGLPNGESDEYPVGIGPLANRLDIDLGYEPENLGDPHAPPARPWRMVLGGGKYVDIAAYRPKLPAGVGLFDAVVVDGRGLNAPHPDLNNDGFYSLDEAMRSEVDRYDLARGFTGHSTRGLVNINTASVEVMRALPQMSRLVYNDFFEYGPLDDRGGVQRSAVGTPAGEARFNAPFSNHMHVRFAEAIERYRSGDAHIRSARDFNESNATWAPQPSMADRGFVGREFAWLADSPDDEYDSIGNGFYGFLPGMRNERGIVSIGELLAMQRTPYEEYYLINGTGPGTGSRWVYRNASVRGLGLSPYSNIGNPAGSGGLGWGDPPPTAQYARSRFCMAWRDDMNDELPSPRAGAEAHQADARVSTDRNTLRRTLLGKRGRDAAPVTEFAPDIVGGDAEEMNMLFSGLANMITTRSDVFTIYLKVRTFKQDPSTGVWDASTPGNIIEESRYVMVIDRSAVNGPTDKPKILAFAKVE